MVVLEDIKEEEVLEEEEEEAQDMVTKTFIILDMEREGIKIHKIDKILLGILIIINQCKTFINHRQKYFNSKKKREQIRSRQKINQRLNQKLNQILNQKLNQRFN